MAKSYLSHENNAKKCQEQSYSSKIKRELDSHADKCAVRKKREVSVLGKNHEKTS